MTEAGFLLIGLVTGGIIGWYICALRARGMQAADAASLSEVRAQLSSRDAELAALRQTLDIEKISAAKANERLDAAREHFAEQRRQIDQMQEKAREMFRALSADALKTSNEQFITLAETRFKPIREQLERYEAQVKALEETRTKAYAGLTERVDALKQHSERLSGETGQLVAALRASGTKGKWGEVTLQRIVELSGMTEHCDFDIQSALEGGGRPDLVVHLPGGRMLAIDSKVNTGAYLDAAAATDDAERKRFLSKYVADVRTTLRSLSGREYWKQFSPAPELVVMFMPGEAFFSAALAQDSDLLIDGVGQGVLLASPTTLIALLLAVRHGWQQQQVAENAERIAEAGRDLYDRLCTFVSHLESVRLGIEKAADAYNKAIGNWTGRTLPSARKLKDLGAADPGKELVELPPMEIQLRAAPADPDDVTPESRRAV